MRERRLIAEPLGWRDSHACTTDRLRLFLPDDYTDRESRKCAKCKPLSRNGSVQLCG